jgi:Glycosyl hydrolase-like 10/Concanavalin A-like lectin/glucanases superfamily
MISNKEKKIVLWKSGYQRRILPTKEAYHKENKSLYLNYSYIKSIREIMFKKLITALMVVIVSVLAYAGDDVPSIYNADFAKFNTKTSAPTGWTNYPGRAIKEGASVKKTAGIVENTSAVKISNGPTKKLFCLQDIKVKNSGDFTLTFHAKGSGAGLISISFDGANRKTTGKGFSKIFYPNDDFRQYFFKVTIPPETVKMRLHIGAFKPDSTITYYNMKFLKGVQIPKKIKKKIVVKNTGNINDNILFKASFTKSIQPEISVDKTKIKWYGNPKIAKGEGLNNSNAILTGIHGYGTFPADNINVDQGTICFWYKPLGDPLGNSHTFFSWGWNFKSSYTALSQGWWEGGGGGGKTYFIINNHVKGVRSPSIIQIGQWSFFAVNWKINKDRKMEVGFYRNGKKIAKALSIKKLPKDAEIITPVFLGSDKGTYMTAGRYINGYLNDFTIYDRQLTFAEIDEIFLTKAPKQMIADMKNPWAWMNDAINKFPREKRDKNGKLLESRIIFAEGNVINYYPQKQMKKALDRLKYSGFNVYMPIVWHGRGTEYYTKSAPMSPRYKNFMKKYPGYNAYKEFISEAHKRGIEVHSSFAVMQGGHKSPAWPQYSKGRWNNGYNGEFRKKIIKLMVDHVKEYDVDGINLDFIRIQGGLDTPEAARDYKIVYARDLSKDRKDSKRMLEYVNHCVSEIVSEVRKQTKAIKPKLIISCASTPQLKSQGLFSNGRSSSMWLDKGWVDVVLCMDYGQRIGTSLLDACRKESNKPWGYVEGLGNYDWKGSKCLSRDPKIFAKLIDYCRRKYNDGNGLFVYFWTRLSDEQIKALRKGPFKELAKPSWKR